MEKKIDVIRAWKDSKYRESLSLEELKGLEKNPIGEPFEDLESVFGGYVDGVIRSSAGDGFQGCGFIPSVSGECNGGKCCNPFYSWGYSDSSKINMY